MSELYMGIQYGIFRKSVCKVQGKCLTRMGFKFNTSRPELHPASFATLCTEMRSIRNLSTAPVETRIQGPLQIDQQTIWWVLHPHSTSEEKLSTKKKQAMNPRNEDSNSIYLYCTGKDIALEKGMILSRFTLNAGKVIHFSPRLAIQRRCHCHLWLILSVFFQKPSNKHPSVVETEKFCIGMCKVRIQNLTIQTFCDLVPANCVLIEWPQKHCKTPFKTRFAENQKSSLSTSHGKFRLHKLSEKSSWKVLGFKTVNKKITKKQPRWWEFWLKDGKKLGKIA